MATTEELGRLNLRLPPELIQMIASFATPIDLLSVRLVCREIEAAVFQLFTKTFFTEPCYVPACRKSMEILRQVSKHPIFGRSIQRIHLRIVREPPPTPDLLVHQCGCFDSSLVTELQKFLWCGRDMKYLKESLQNFMALGNHPIIVASPSAGEGRVPPLHLQYLTRIRGCETCASWRTPFGNTYLQISRAIDQANYPVVGLEMGDQHGVVKVDDISDLAYGTATHTLKSLRLTTGLQMIISLVLRTFIREKCLGALERFQNLETLSLSQHGLLRGHSILHSCVEQRSTLMLPRLRVLELQHQYLNQTRLLEFCARRSATMEVLKIRRLENSDPRKNSPALLTNLARALRTPGKAYLLLETTSCYGEPDFRVELIHPHLTVKVWDTKGNLIRDDRETVSESGCASV